MSFDLTDSKIGNINILSVDVLNSFPTLFYYPNWLYL